MNRVAIVACNTAHSMRGSPHVASRQALRVTAQTDIEAFGRGQNRKRLNRRFAAVRIDVGLPRTVAAFATAIFGSLVRQQRPVVRILIEREPHVGVTGLAHRAAHVCLRRRIRPNPVTEQQQRKWGREAFCPAFQADQSDSSVGAPDPSSRNVIVKTLQIDACVIGFRVHVWNTG